MGENPCDALDSLVEHMDEWLTWCDQNGEYDTGSHSLSDESIRKARDLVDVAAQAYALHLDVAFPDGVDSMSWLAFDVGGKPSLVERKHV